MDQSRRRFISNFVTVAMAVLGVVKAFLEYDHARPEPIVITPGTGSLTLNGGKPVVDVITLTDFANVKLA